ncbi:AraC family transcriptional regulator [Luteimonas sp. Y-2-2-4F]|nr:AraC family transcriptional regulator [Luteimonas sp. Y-2-2-4F]MCD9030223.1 AraC family transcriptional regulator [Luteimonas sp. Y-2-2-4F]
MAAEALPVPALPALRELVSRHAVADATDTRVPGLGLHRADASTQPLAVVYEPMLCIVVQGRKRVVFGDTVRYYDAAHYLVVSLDLPVVGAVCEASAEVPYLAVSVRLDRADLAALLMRMPSARDAAPPRLGLEVAAMEAPLADACLRLVQLLDAPDDIPVLAPLVRRELLYRLLRGPQGPMLRQIARGEGRLGQVQQAIAWIREHYDRPLRIDALAAHVALSSSSLHRHFKAATRLSPLQYQKQVRLQAARERLIAEPGDAAAVAYAVGYESASQFSREFKRLFGHPPGEAVRRWREDGAPA